MEVTQGCVSKYSELPTCQSAFMGVTDTSMMSIPQYVAQYVLKNNNKQIRDKEYFLDVLLTNST